MFDADVDSLFDVPVSDTFVDDDADGGFCDVVDDTGFTVVDFVGHAGSFLGDVKFRRISL